MKAIYVERSAKYLKLEILLCVTFDGSGEAKMCTNKLCVCICTDLDYN